MRCKIRLSQRQAKQSDKLVPASPLETPNEPKRNGMPCNTGSEWNGMGRNEPTSDLA